MMKPALIAICCLVTMVTAQTTTLRPPIRPQTTRSPPREPGDRLQNASCTLSLENFMTLSRCARECVRRNDSGCFNCTRACNETSNNQEPPMNECSRELECSADNRLCVAVGPSIVNRCQQRPMEGEECGRVDDPRDFDFRLNDGRDNDRNREESLRRDQSDERRRTSEAVGGARDRSATRNLEQSAQVDRECETNLRCNDTTRRCVPMPTGPCTMERTRNPGMEIQCDDNGMFNPLQCRRQQNNNNMFRCFCVNRQSGEMIAGTEQMNIADRDDRRIPMCNSRSFRNCTVRHNNRNAVVPHGTETLRSSDCMVCQCNNGQLERCRNPGNNVDCSRSNPGNNPQNCRVRGMTVEHGQRRMVDDCNMCGCNNGRTQCTEIRQCMRDGDQKDEQERACDSCRDQPQRIVSSTDGRNFPSMCSAVNCSRRRRNQLRNGSSADQRQCSLNPCRSGFSCVQQGGRSCNRLEGCEADDVRMCVDRNNLTVRVPMRPMNSMAPNPADRDRADAADRDGLAVCSNNNVTYDSLANLVREGPANARVNFSGPCNRTECNGGQVCGTDSVDYANRCVLQSQSPNARVDYTGQCMGRNMNMTTDNICERVRQNNRCNHTAENCQHRISPTSGCCPVCGGIVTLALDEQALDEHTRATGQLTDLDDLMVNFVQGGMIRQNISDRCEMAATKTTTTRFSNVEITLNARNRNMDSEFCNKESREIADRFNNPTSDDPVEASFVLAATDVPLVATEGAPMLAASTLTVVFVTLISLVY